MLDPEKMKKGGFGASAELARERREERDKASQNGTSPTATPTPPVVDTGTTAPGPSPTEPGTP